MGEEIAFASLVLEGLKRVTSALPGGRDRPGQQAMAEAVASAITEGRHLVVQAGTGTGKSLGYLVPAILAKRHVLVATATKALQEQLIDHDIPLLERSLGISFKAVLLKGRSNYLCKAALAGVEQGAGQGVFAGGEGFGDQPLAGGRLDEVVSWSQSTVSGDRSDAPLALSDREWGQVSVGVGECPGAKRCSFAEGCFAEKARADAEDADVVVVNTHLFGLDLASGGSVLPIHDVVVIDEAHALEDIAADTLGLRLGPGRLDHVLGGLRALFTADHPGATALARASDRLREALGTVAGQRVDPQGQLLATVLLSCSEAVSEVLSAARSLDVGGSTESGSRRDRLVQLASGLLDDLRSLGELSDDEVAWVEDGNSPVLRVAPVDVGARLAMRLFSTEAEDETPTTVVLTSATLAVGGSFDSLAGRLGLDRASLEWDGLDVGSPFDYPNQALLYCAAHLPDPRAADFEAAMHAEMEALMLAAGGRTLALFTSRRAMEAAAGYLGDRHAFQVLVQDALPRPVLHETFLKDETSVLLATMGFWQGFDAPGRTCSLVVIDRLPFSRPDDPLVEARRQAATKARQNAFAAVDLPRAAVLLAQGTGRLIRSGEDKGVVAVLDRRLATASYRWDLVRSLPPMRRSKDHDEAAEYLASLSDE
ncbi:MAG: ATP-dependent DNA helicase [Acidimicrobiales bacterium]